jgi:hypothetical protein
MSFKNLLFTNVFRISLIVMILNGFSVIQVCSQSSTKAKIMVLGSYHMANPGADAFNMQADDVLSAHRQKEMESLVSMLSKFKPTKILLEVNSTADSAYNVLYTKFVQGTHTLSKSEAQQIGFRLAKNAKHSKIYCVDVTGKFELEPVMAFGMQQGMGNFIQSMMGKMQSQMQDETNLLQKSTLQQYFAHLNESHNQDSSLAQYMELSKINNGKSYPGAELIADVFERNIKIMANIIKTVDCKDDRILVIYGNGHAPFFKSLLIGSELLEWVPSIDYLK